MDAAVDHGNYLRKALCEIAVESYRATSRDPVPQLFQNYVITDCKSLYDHLIRLSPPSNVEEKRVAIDICAIKEGIEPRFVRWVPTHVQLADHFTKVIAPAELCALIASGWLRVVERKE